MGNQEKKKWLGQTEACDICRGSLKVEDSFYDAKTKQGPWATMCKSCFRYYGIGLGTGKGQEYSSITLAKTKG